MVKRYFLVLFLLISLTSFATCLIEDTSSAENTNNETSEDWNKMCLAPSGRFPNPDDCGEYFECRDGQATKVRCHRFLMYDFLKFRCDYESWVSCYDRKKPIREDDSNSAEPEEDNINCTFSGGIFPHPVECAKFIICNDDKPRVYRCKDSEYYDIWYRECRDKRRVYCEDRLTPENFTTTKRPTTSTTKATKPTTLVTKPTETVIKFKCPRMSGTFPHPVECAKFYFCKWGVHTLLECPHSQLYDEASHHCMDKSKVNCGDRLDRDQMKAIKIPLRTSPMPNITKDKSSKTPEIPSTNFKLSTQPTTTTMGIVTKPNTPPSTGCDKDDIDCIINGTKDLLDWFDCPERFGYFPHSASRLLFIHCDNGKPFIKTCPEKTVFDPSAEVCVWM